MKKLIATAVAGAAILLAGCSSQADVVSRNVSNDAEEFKVDRRIVAVNLITDEYLLQLTGKCSIETEEVKNRLAIICRVGADQYMKQYVGFTPGAQVAYTIEQLATSNVDSYRYQLILRPQQVVPIVIG